MRTVVDLTLAITSDIRLLFVTNIQSGEMADLGPDGVLNTVQYYTRRQADSVIRSLQELGVTVDAFFSEQEFLAAVTQSRTGNDAKHTVVFTTAEGGTGSGRRALIPAVCKLLELPVLNSGAHASSLARHKFHANAVLRRLGLRAPGTWLFSDGRWLGGLEPNRDSRVIAKPTYESQGIGVGGDSVLVVDEGFERALRDKERQFGQPVIVQEFVSGEEVGVPILRMGPTYALPPVAFRRRNGEPFDRSPKTFRDEHVERDLAYVPFDRSAREREVVQEAAVLAFDGLGMKGAGRIDFRIDVDGRAWIFDTNESPPPIPHTAYAFAMEHLGFSVGEMLAAWLGACLIEEGLISGV
jgi:D-alanine-D-alanine ligase